MTLINITFTIILIVLKPFKSKNLNRLRICSEILFTLGILLLLILPWLEEKQNLLFYKLFGWVIVVILILVLIIEISSLLFIKNKPKKKHKKKIISNRIVPQLQEESSV